MEESKIRTRIEEQAMRFGYACDDKYHKSFTPIDRKNGFIAGAEYELKRVLILIDAHINDSVTEEDIKALQKLRRLILEL